MIFLAITSADQWTWNETWMVTGLGFCLVLVLLFAFVYVMKGLGWIMQAIEKKATAPKVEKKAEVQYSTDADEATKAAIAMTLNLASNDPEYAAVAYSLHLYYNSLHDMEAPRLTLTHRSSSWNEKTFGINNLDR